MARRGGRRRSEAATSKLCAGRFPFTWRKNSTFSLFLVFLICAAFAQSITGGADAATATQKIAQLNKLQKHGVVELDNESYEEYINAPRPYGLVLLLTAMSREHACTPCSELDPEFRLVASSWSKQKTDDRLYFGVIEYKRGMDVYRKLGLTSAPTIIYYPPLEGPRSGGEEVRYELHRLGLRANPLADWVSGLINQKLRVIRPVDWSRYALMICGLLFALAVGKVLLTNFGYLLQFTGLWGAGALVMILMMCSGHMWNHIRKPPYAVTGHNGKFEWIAGGLQQQFVLESQVFAMLQAVAAFSVVTLAVRVPQVKDQRAAIALALGAAAVLIIDVSIVLWVFRIKNGGYPFKLLF